MAVYKKRTCTQCGATYQDGKEKSPPPVCSKCGGAATYSLKWHFCVYVINKAGKRVQIRRAVSKYKAEAQAAEAEALRERSEGGTISAMKKAATFASAVETFEKWIIVRLSEGKLAPSTAKFYRTRISAHLLPYFGATKLCDIDHVAASSFIAERKSTVIHEFGDGTRKCPSIGDVNRDLATLKRIMSVAVSSGLIKHSPLEGFELMPEDGERERYLSDEEIKALLMEARKPRHPIHLYPILMVALNTGLRRDGVITLRWEEIDWKSNEIVKTVKHHRIKGRTEVRIPMTDDLREVLHGWRVRGGVHRASGYVFPSPYNQESSMGTGSRFGFETACKAAGIKGVHFHDLRRTFATHFLEQFPEHIEVLKVLMGHSGAYMTRLYARITDRSRHNLIGKFEITKGWK